VLNLLYIGNNSDVISTFNDLTSKFKFHQSPNGLKAITFLKEGNKPDAIVCESHLQGMNGIEIGKMIRSITEFVKTPFIIFSCENDPKIIKAAFKARSIVDDIYQFPFDLDKLRIRIEYLIEYYNTIKDKKKPDSAFKEYKVPFLKRSFDIIVSFFALLFLSPILLFVAIAIRLESKGAIVYKSERVGTGYKIFNFLKFRSMNVDADKDLKDLKHLNQYSVGDESDESNELNTNCPECKKLQEGEYCSPILYIKGLEICEHWYFEQKKKQDVSTFVKIKNDPRVTKIGNFIRNTSIDELPQLINVLKGDMSIVGNRPLPLYEAEQLTSDDWSARFMGPAGITGLWQVELRGKKGVMSEEERKALDNKYAETYSFLGDIRLILRTIPALLQKENV
jgi:lipopolysaccharide/colanic/teichoic acid biosynthesis glycosyltransferase